MGLCIKRINMNVVVKNEQGRVIEFFKGIEAEKIRNIFNGMDVQETEEFYSKKWGRWWPTLPVED